MMRLEGRMRRVGRSSSICTPEEMSHDEREREREAWLMFTGHKTWLISLFYEAHYLSFSLGSTGFRLHLSFSPKFSSNDCNQSGGHSVHPCARGLVPYIYFNYVMLTLSLWRVRSALPFKFMGCSVWWGRPGHWARFTVNELDRMVMSKVHSN